ncbi:DUF883 family protein [Halioxenophilus aromaticivorans]|uniref:DUF883 domain-containing protein n=1 Tax=Halioxenophilus aromaticivorans TaxID=1306992 RepID=A0AAV3U8B0_9ALTE
MSKANTITEPTNHTVAERVAAAAHNAIDQASPKLEQMEQRLRTGSEDTSAYVKEKSDEAKQKFNDGLEQSKDFARRNPVLTIGAAFTAGALVAALLGKRK